MLYKNVANLSVYPMQQSELKNVKYLPRKTQDDPTPFHFPRLDHLFDPPETLIEGSQTWEHLNYQVSSKSDKNWLRKRLSTFGDPSTNPNPNPNQAFIDNASIIWKNEHNFCTFYKNSTASIISIFLLVFFLRNITRVMTCLVSKIDCFQVRSMVHSLYNFAMSWGKKVTAKKASSVV